MNSVLIGIDELFDTRTATMQVVTTPNQFIQMLEEGYGKRETDRWDTYVPYSEFQEAYAHRNTDTVKGSTVTCVVPALAELVLNILSEYNVSPIEKIPTVYINIPPRYRFTSDELTEIGRQIINAIGTVVPIKFLHYKVVTPAKMKELEIGHVFTYSFLDWLEMATLEATLTVKDLIPEVAFYTARVHTSDDPFSKSTLDQGCLSLASSLAPLCKIVYVAAALFTSPIVVNLYSGDAVSSS